jgi:hypothetical protein
MPYLIKNAYRELLPMMADLHDLEATGKGRPEQWQIVAKSRAPEELYDSAKDPWNVVNRINDPALQAEVAELRGALDQWTSATGDLGLIVPESRMVRDKLWQGATSQPRTAAPEVKIGGGKVSIACATEGASIGYRLAKSGPWRVYVEPFSVKQDVTIQVVAHRIGWKRAMASITVQAQIGASSPDSPQRP